MRIQIIETGPEEYDVRQLNWFKESCDTWATQYGIEKLEWIHTNSTHLKADVLLKPISDTEILIGFVDDEIDENLHYINIQVSDSRYFDALTQVLLITIGMGYLQSITGSFSTDWSDIKTALRQANKGFCYADDWTGLFEENLEFFFNSSQLHPVKIIGSAMLLNQGLTMSETFHNIQQLMQKNLFTENCLNIVNITQLEMLKSTNIFLFVFKNPEHQQSQDKFVKRAH